jgi:alpha-ketoglutarate-dependent taurine dioxygenase
MATCRSDTCRCATRKAGDRAQRLTHRIRDLLDSLFRLQEEPRFIYEHRWTVGDQLICDNRCMLHARSNFDGSELRKMRRITVRGDRVS